MGEGIYLLFIIECDMPFILFFNLRSVLCSCTVSLTGVDMGHTTSKVAIRFANILRNLIPSSDVGVMEMTANAMGKLALASSTITAEYVEYESKRAFEWLSGDRHEGRRHAAVSSSHCETLPCMYVSKKTYEVQL